MVPTRGGAVAVSAARGVAGATVVAVDHVVEGGGGSRGHLVQERVLGEIEQRTTSRRNEERGRHRALRVEAVLWIQLMSAMLLLTLGEGLVFGLE